MQAIQGVLRSYPINESVIEDVGQLHHWLQHRLTIFVGHELFFDTPDSKNAGFSIYGRVNWTAIVLLVVATVVGWGLVINGFAEDAAWNNWQGYLLPLIGGEDSDWYGANIGVVLGLLIGFFGYWAASVGQIKKQERR